MLVVALYCGFGGIMELFPHDNLKDDDQFIVIIEWNLVLVCLVWFLSFTFDWKNLRLTIFKSGKVRMLN